MTPDLHAAATQLAADLATLHRAGRIASVWRAGMAWVAPDGRRTRVLGDSFGVCHGTARGRSWDVPGRMKVPEYVEGAAIPDLTDDATIDGVVRLAREALASFGLGVCYLAWDGYTWQWETASGALACPIARTRPGRCCVGGPCNEPCVAPTETRAACAAIRAAAAGVGT